MFVAKVVLNILNGACYIRVSTDDQTEYSPDAQLKALRNYAKQNNIRISDEHIYIDEGISGRNANKRPAFQLMIATAKSKPKPFDVILVHKFDRFARSREDSVVYKSLLKREADVKVVSTTESIEDDKFSIILEAMLEAMAEYYSLNLAEEVRKGMTEKAHRGEYQSAPPLGYTMENKKLVIFEKEAEIVRLIFEKFSSKEMGMRALAVHINDLGIKSKRGKVIESRQIEYIVNNPVYIGKVRWTPTEKVRRNYNHPDTITTDGHHEPIISQELWDKTQEVIKENKDRYTPNLRRTSKKITWLHGLVYCGTCDRKLVRSAYTYLQCSGYSKGQCKTSHATRHDILEELVLEALKKDLASPLEISVTPMPSDYQKTNEFTHINEQLEAFEERFERIKTSYQHGIDTLEEYELNKVSLSAEREKAIARLKELKETILSANNVQIVGKRLKNIHKLLTNDGVDFDIKYREAHALISKIKYEKKEKTLKLQYKL